MKFCQHCAGPVRFRIPEGDDKPRYCCERCDSVFYQNPKNVVGTVPDHEGRILLCRRAIAPRQGLWTLPAGFMENGETSLAGAIRETTEEAGARIEVGENPLYTLFNLPYINQVYLFFRARLLDLNFTGGPESLEVVLFEPADIPWDDLAFPVVRSTLEYYIADMEQNHFPVRMFDVHYDDDYRAITSLISESATAR
ncbi:MAG: NUDIX hydrolase [Pseudohongiellaceae bacterium]